MSGTEAKIEITAGTGRLPSALRAALKMVQGFVHATTGLMKQRSEAEQAKPDRRSLAMGSFIGNIGANLAMRGIDIMVDQTKEVFEFEKQLTRFGIAANKTPQQMRAIGDAARETSNNTGLSALEVLNAARAYVDLAGAAAFSVTKMNILARAAQASGASTKDLAGMMYQLGLNMHIPESDMENTIGGLINQAKMGAIEPAQMSAEFAGILPLFKRFGVLGREGTVQVGAMFQVMREGANSAPEAATMIQRMYAAIQTNASKFEKGGIQIFEKYRDKLGRKVYLPSAQILHNIWHSEAIKDPQILKKMVGRTEGWRGILLGDEAARAFGGTDEAIDKHISHLEELENAGRVDGVVQRDLATMTESSAGRMERAVETVKNKFADMLTPQRINQIVGGIETIADSIGPLLSMAGALATVLSGIVNAGRWAGNTWRRGKQGLTDEEYDFFISHRLTPGTNTPADNARMKSLGGYSNAVAGLEDLEEDRKPTAASVERAVAVFRAGMNKNERRDPLTLDDLNATTPEQDAAANYLRRSGAGTQMFDAANKRVLAQLKAQDDAEVQANIDAGRGYSAKGQALRPPIEVLPPAGGLALEGSSSLGSDELTNRMQTVAAANALTVQMHAVAATNEAILGMLKSSPFGGGAAMTRVASDLGGAIARGMNITVVVDADGKVKNPRTVSR